MRRGLRHPDGGRKRNDAGEYRNGLVQRGDGGWNVTHEGEYRTLTNVLQVPAAIGFVETLAKRLTFAREAKQLTQAQLAKTAGVASGTIGMLEAGRRLTARKIVGIAGVLGVRVQWLAEGIGPMRDGEAPQGHQWPFEGISPEAWAALSERQRGAVEDAAATKMRELVSSKPRKRA